MKLLEAAKMLIEGGHAVQHAQPISKEDIPATIELISKVSGIPKEDLRPLGSVGKKATSGDIDLAVDVSKYDTSEEGEIHQRMCKYVGGNCVWNKGTNVASYGFPIAGDPAKGIVQLDFMPVGNPKWAQFAYHSPYEGESQYKGNVRTILLMAVASTINETDAQGRNKDAYVYDPETGELIIRAGRTLDLNKGLRRILQHLPRNKKTGKYLASAKTIDAEEFASLYPDIDYEKGDITMDDPQQVLDLLFGGGVTPKDVNTGEQVIELINTKFDEERKKLIMHTAAKRLLPLEQRYGQNIPDEVKEYA